MSNLVNNYLTLAPTQTGGYSTISTTNGPMLVYTNAPARRTRTPKMERSGYN